MGESESKAYDGLDLSNEVAVASADSTIIGIQMIGVDARYTKGALQLRGQYIVANLSNTDPVQYTNWERFRKQNDWLLCRIRLQLY